VGIAYTTISQIALVDQSSGQTSASIAAQELEAAYANYSSYAAEDLTVPTGEQWHLDSLMLFGQYVTPSGTPVPGAGIIVSIHADQAGLPGAVLFTDTLASGADVDMNGNLRYAWDSSYVLNPGGYWLVAAARKDLGASQTQWQWFSTTSTEGDTALWINPGGGFTFNNCPNWNEVTTCYGSTLPGLSFTLFGCPGLKPVLFGLPADTAICSNDQLSFSVSSSSAASTYAWSNGLEGPAFQSAEAGIYTITLTDTITGCAITDSMVVSMVLAPELALVDTFFCAGSSVPLGVNVCEHCTVIWSSGQSTDSIHVNAEGSYWAVVSDTQSECITSDTAWVEQYNMDDVMFDPGQGVGFCPGDSVAISVQDTFMSYSWSTGGSDAEIQVDTPGFVRVTVTAANECSKVDSLLVMALPEPEPQITISFQAGVFILSVPPIYEEYLWSSGGGDGPTIQAEWGDYLLIVKDSNGCVGSASIGVPLGNEQSTESPVMVYPNPVDQHLWIDMPADWSTAELSIFNATGAILTKRQVKTNAFKWDLSSLVPGSYFVVIQNEHSTFTQTIIKQ
jgi:hypothetical protein